MMLSLMGTASGGDSLSPAVESTVSAEERFYAEQQEKLVREYRECTGDTAAVTLEEIVRWRTRLYETVETPAYQRALRSYQAHTGAGTDAMPCKVLQWQRRQRQQIEETETKLVSAMHDKVERYADTLLYRSEFANSGASPFDIADIPLGISATSLKLGLSQRYADGSVTETNSSILVEGVHIDSRPFAVTFLLDSTDRYAGYQIDGTRFPPDSLDGPVRSEARHLLRWLRHRAGPPRQEYRIGLFDIKADRLAPYARWASARRQATVGIAASHHHFFARARVLARPGADDDRHTGHQTQSIPEKNDTTP
jgi:hypothetical protein